MHSDILEIEILYTNKCRNWPKVVDLLKQALEELDLPHQISTREIKDRNEAQALSFFGSPTIRVNGEDLEPGASGKINLA
ncbi:MAG: DUF2703 domain-containing protein [Thermodesulfobacteria bacterium]|nr:DUF2703 domain-containing protein [Thermodesulfobacteriota bacterium]